MRLTYTDIKKAHFRNIGKAGQFNDATLLEDFQYSLGQRYQMVFGIISSYVNADVLTASTVASQQYYSYPVGTVSTDSMTITIGSMKYTLNPIYDQHTWNMLNALQMQPTAIPQFFFPRKDDFGIWPIPTATYTITLDRFLRDRNMLVDDHAEGSVGLTAGSTTVVGTSTSFTAAMEGRWFTVNNTATPGQGYWYRVASVTSTTSLELENSWEADTVASTTYRIGETPELPEQAHILLPAGTASDFYSGLRNDGTEAIRFDNSFWTGSYNNNSRDFGDRNIKAGVIGLYNNYQARDRDHIIQRQPRIISPSYKIFAQEIT